MNIKIRVKNGVTYYDKTIALTLNKDGFWLYDTTRRMNLAVRAKSKDEAFVEALLYYQDLVAQLETSLSLSEEKIQKILKVLDAEEITL